MKQLELFAPASEHPEDVGPGYGFFKAVCITGDKAHLLTGREYWVKNLGRSLFVDDEVYEVREWSEKKEAWMRTGDAVWYKSHFKEV